MLLTSFSVPGYGPVPLDRDASGRAVSLQSCHHGDLSEYQSLTGALQHLILMRLNLSYAVQLVRQFMHDLHELHLVSIKQILRFVKGILSVSLHISVRLVISLTAYSNADWTDC